MLVFNDKGNLSIETNWAFNLFNIFDMQRSVQAHQSVLIDENVPNEEITLVKKGDKSKSNLIPFEIININE